MRFTIATTKETALAPFNLPHPVLHCLLAVGIPHLGHMVRVNVKVIYVIVNKSREMAYVLKSGFRVLSGFEALTVKSHRLSRLEGLISRRWVTAGSSEHTLAVRQQIQDTRTRGQEAGGAKRIDAQHKKVVNQELDHDETCRGCGI